MFRKIKNVLFVICAVMVFTAQTNRPDDKAQQHHAPAARPASVSRPVPAVHSFQSRPQIQKPRPAPQQTVRREMPTAQPRVFQAARQERQGPRVYAVPEPVPVENNRLLNRQHHNHWRPRYNFYDNGYHFYPYVNITSPMELSPNCISLGFQGETYFYDQGTFYQQDAQGHYLAVAPPVGIIVNPLAAGARQIVVDDQVFYRYKGVFYVQVAGGYQVIAPVQPVPADA